MNVAAEAPSTSTMYFVMDLYLIVLCLLVICIRDSLQGPHEKRLLNNLLATYNTLERPVANESESLEVKFGLTLQQIIDVVSGCKKWKNCVRGRISKMLENVCRRKLIFIFTALKS